MEFVSTQAVPADTVPTPQQISNSSSLSLDFEQFLHLFVSQLKYQDPLSPMEGQEFLAQTAQFSSVEQLVNLNSKMGYMADAAQLSGRATTAALIGCTATARSVDGDGVETEISGRVVRVDYGPGGTPVLGFEDGTSVPLADVLTLAET
jgi:flagellar basal-body rod modification protein FlgD